MQTIGGGGGGGGEREITIENETPYIYFTVGVCMPTYHVLHCPALIDLDRVNEGGILTTPHMDLATATAVLNIIFWGLLFCLPFIQVPSTSP